LLRDRKEEIEIKIKKTKLLNILGLLLIMSATLYTAGYIKSLYTFIALYAVGMTLILTVGIVSRRDR
jgi:hypothetical protein